MATESSAPSGAPSKGRIFLRRLSSSAVLWAVVVGALFCRTAWLSESLFLTAMVAIAGLGLREFYALAEKRQQACFKGLGLAGGVLLMAGTFWYHLFFASRNILPAKANDFETGILVVLFLGVCLRQFLAKSSPRAMEAVGTTLLGWMYVPWLLNFIQKLHFFPAASGNPVDGNLYVLFFVLVTKFSDLGAYVTGSLCGRHKMIPRISPGKTWEGFAGAVVVSTGVSVLFCQLAGDKLYGMNLRHAVVLGVLLSVSAVVGDLIESIFKREAGVKDSGSLFPGIGGMLDLMDSLLFNAPIMYLYLRHVLTRP